MISSKCGDQIVQLVLPPSDHHVRTARLVAADAATRAGFDCDETDDLRIAVDEMCHLLLRWGRGPLWLSFTGDPEQGVSVDASVERASKADADDIEFASAVIGWVADSFDITTDSGQLRFVLSKRHAEGAGCKR